MYSKLTIKNRSAIKRFSHSRRFKVALDILNLENGETALDYGAGDGYFISSLAVKYPQANIIGYEPVKDMFDQLAFYLHSNNINVGCSIVQKLDDLSNNSIDKITCFEVLEHLDDELQRVAIDNMMRLLKRDGLILISVPIEVGLSSLIKNLIRLIIRQPHGRTNIRNIIKSVFGIPIERERIPYIYSHLGFYYFDLERTLAEEGLIIKQKIYSPFKWLRGIVNSQIFYVLSRS